jgi:plasmid replication initiation protein
MVLNAVDLSAFDGEMLKPNELIQIKGAGPLTLADRRVFNLLLHNAWGKEILKHQHLFTIDTTDLKDRGQSNNRLRQSLERLQTTLVIAFKTDGGVVNSQLLGSTDIKPTGEITYSFPVHLAELLKDSSVFAKLDLEVMKSFSSKYAFALYEAVARRINLKHKFTEDLSIDDVRQMLGVEDGKLGNYRNLRLKAIEPAVAEVNAIAPYQITLLPVHKGRKVVGFKMGWSVKNEAAMKAAYAELHRPRIGRKQRLSGDTDKVVE